MNVEEWLGSDNKLGIDIWNKKYRYKNENDRILALHNVKKFHDRYNYSVGVQMILTQYLIDQVKDGKLNINDMI